MKNENTKSLPNVSLPDIGPPYFGEVSPEDVLSLTFGEPSQETFTVIIKKGSESQRSLLDALRMHYKAYVK